MATSRSRDRSMELFSSVRLPTEARSTKFAELPLPTISTAQSEWASTSSAWLPSVPNREENDANICPPCETTFAASHRDGEFAVGKNGLAGYLASSSDECR